MQHKNISTSEDNTNLYNDVIVFGMVGACLAVSYAVSGCSNNLSTICNIAAVIQEGVGGSVQTMANIAAIGVTGFYCLARLFPAEKSNNTRSASFNADDAQLAKERFRPDMTI